jgi:beta-lactamase superfamily II metal-dependent hydrolase
MATIHFLNVGHGDCTVIEHTDGKITMIDINNGGEFDEEEAKPILEQVAPTQATYLAQVMAGQQGWKSWGTLLGEAGYKISLTNPVEFMQRKYPDRPIFRFILSHPDFDHIRGLDALESSGTKIFNFWDTKHSRDWDPNKDKHSDKPDWDAYQRLRSGNQAKLLFLHRGDKGKYFNQDENGVEGGNGLEILSPTPELVRDHDEDGKRNELSYVIRYTTAGRTIIFGGDAEKNAWESILASYGSGLKCDVLRASHHGRDSGYHQEAVKAMGPGVAVVSVGKKPETDATNKYRNYCSKVWSTRWYGDLTLEIDANGNMSWTATNA